MTTEKITNVSCVLVTSDNMAVFCFDPNKLSSSLKEKEIFKKGEVWLFREEFSGTKDVKTGDKGELLFIETKNLGRWVWSCVK